MEYGELLPAMDLILEMVKLCVENLDTSTLVSLHCMLYNNNKLRVVLEFYCVKTLGVHSYCALIFMNTICVHAGAQIFSSSLFGQKTGPVSFTGLSCAGTEYSPADCPHFSPSYYSSSDIGVRCLQKGSYRIAFLCSIHSCTCVVVYMK